ncbi:uncharacterized protein LOC123475235 [Daphnia magna]|uniref:Uncharacterized protein n=2 Tax=Daphnia magna TaxID=35525 RepID=A0ABR0B796_9CRUS|nr:uncharacterized protein LOC116928396 [Daphnia magna]XP_045033584.1 uncharacterized protein LOC123475235 [Daphnia magna]KAK4037545.1 hypothetical protein OUZ56_029577 [Daphnia magna]KAK4037546.1 hypothetical protein OUZ56_029578 [Daphnia magna]KZS20642.1 Uncharacterized protein APZ42_012568 [Daphnia magna]
MNKSIDKIGEAIHLAAQEDLDSMKDDSDVKKFEELIQKLELQRRLVLEGEVRKRKLANFKLNENVNSPQELVEKTQLATVKSEENMQLYMICQKAVETSQFSLTLQSAETRDLADDYADEEIAGLSAEYINLCLSNLAESHKNERLDEEIKQAQENINQLKPYIFPGEANEEVQPGSRAKEIAKVKARLVKLRGRYNFTRYILQLLLLASEQDLVSNPKLFDMFVKCGEPYD